MKVYVVGPAKGYASWIKGSVLANDISEADLVLFTGGEDVDPSVYGEPRGRHTLSNKRRDVVEQEAFETAVAARKPILGICRGSQLICALSGGRLVQHQRNPQSTHELLTSDGRGDIYITSSHHQAQFPYVLPKEQYKMMAWTEGLSDVHLDGEDQEMNPEKEAVIVYYPKTRALGIQGHPEWMDRRQYGETFQYLDELVTKLITNKL